MKMYQQHSHENIAEAITRTIEEGTEDKVFTIAILDEVTHENEPGFDVIIVLESKQIILGFITIMEHEGQLAARIRGNFV